MTLRATREHDFQCISLSIQACLFRGGSTVRARRGSICLQSHQPAATPRTMSKRLVVARCDPRLLAERVTAARRSGYLPLRKDVGVSQAEQAAKPAQSMRARRLLLGNSSNLGDTGINSEVRVVTYDPTHDSGTLRIDRPWLTSVGRLRPGPTSVSRNHNGHSEANGQRSRTNHDAR